jgi:CheY-like chemotaxis protein
VFKLLWIEDEWEELLLERPLKELGLQLTCAQTAQQARHLLDTESFDAVLLDIMLPEDDFELDHKMAQRDLGAKLLAELRDPGRQWSTPPSVPVVAYTARGHRTSEELLARAGQPQPVVLHKPLDMQRTLDEVSKIMRRSGQDGH